MPRFLTSLYSSFACLALIFLPRMNAGSNNTAGYYYLPVSAIHAATPAETINLIYDSLKLEGLGLKKEVLAYAYKGYKALLDKGVLNKEELLTICDLSQSSRNKRLYLIDLADYKLILNTHVAHGRNSGGEYASRFSNKPESRQSSLGFFVTGKTYQGRHGLSLTLAGLEQGINDKAERRRIVVHGSDYIGYNKLELSNFMGRSFGCPAVPDKYSRTLINMIKNGSCLFIYHPTEKYLNGSALLNG